MTTTTLVLGGTRSGKSRHAHSLLPRDREVTLIAAGKSAHEADAKQPSTSPEAWTTVESDNVIRSILYARSPVLVDSLSSWVTAILDEQNLWDDHAAALAHIDSKAAELAALWSLAPYDSVAVSHETSLMVVPDTDAGRLFQDAVGRVNQAVSAVSKHVHLVLAGRVLDLSDAPVLARDEA